MPKRTLTVGEYSLVTSVYGESVNLSKVSIYNNKYSFFQPNDTAMTPNGNLYMGAHI
jgi:hypothetical protein